MGADCVRLLGASGNNLKDIDVAFPTGLLSCVTGVSGSGKSTLVNDTLYRIAARRFHHAGEDPKPYRGIEGLEWLDKVVDINQSPIGRTPRSNPATYTGLFTPIRDLFAATPEARSRGYAPGRFSFNVRGGRCEACQGDGVIKVEMHFLPDVYVTCDLCQGARYNRETLDIHYKGLSIAEVLGLSVEDARRLFDPVPAVASKLQTLIDVGLAYIKLGQNATTLSGGEAQRIKLARELSRRDTGSTLYVLDEPTTGLHFHDIEQLSRSCSGYASAATRSSSSNTTSRSSRPPTGSWTSAPRVVRAAARSWPPAPPKRWRPTRAPTPVASSRRYWRGRGRRPGRAQAPGALGMNSIRQLEETDVHDRPDLRLAGLRQHHGVPGPLQEPHPAATASTS